MGGINYFRKLLDRMGKKTGGPSVGWAVNAWANSLEQLHIHKDIAFLGDSLTELNDWQARYPDQDIINLGFYGDTLPGIMERIRMVKAVTPKTVFFLGGINSLRENTVDICMEIYEKAFDRLLEAAPSAKVYIQSLLPVSAEKEKTVCRNTTIWSVNERIKEMAEARGFEYIDVNSHMLKDGLIDPEFTVDGVHLTPKAYETWTKVIEDKVEA